MRYSLLLIMVISVFGLALAGAAPKSTEWSADWNALSNASAINAGQLYAKHCASCHGRDGRARTMKGRLKHARDLADSEWQGRVSDERIFNSIMNGKGKMPAYGKKMSEQEIDAVATYVRGLKR